VIEKKMLPSGMFQRDTVQPLRMLVAIYYDGKIFIDGLLKPSKSDKEKVDECIESWNCRP
jgi:hypothetical protein